MQLLIAILSCDVIAHTVIFSSLAACVWLLVSIRRRLLSIVGVLFASPADLAKVYAGSTV